MKMKILKIMMIVILLAATIFGVYYLWQNRYEYFFQGKLEENNEKTTEENFLDNKDDKKDIAKELSRWEKEDEQESQESYEEINDNSVSVELRNESYKEILATDCGNSCEDKKNTGDYQYCLELCGLRSPKTDLPDNCEGLSGLEKDSCYKTKAVEKKDYAFCNKIEDNNLKESCKNRVLEELL